MKEDSFCFLYYCDQTKPNPDLGFYWMQLSEFRYGFYDREQAIFALESLYDDPLYYDHRNDEYYFRDTPWIKYRIWDFGIAYFDGPPFRSDSPWFVGALRPQERPAPAHLLKENIVVELPGSGASGDMKFKVNFFSG